MCLWTAIKETYQIKIKSINIMYRSKFNLTFLISFFKVLHLLNHPLARTQFKAWESFQSNEFPFNHTLQSNTLSITYIDLLNSKLLSNQSYIHSAAAYMGSADCACGRLTLIRRRRLNITCWQTFLILVEIQLTSYST